MDAITDVFISCDDADWLVEFTRGLVGDGLAACGNIIGGVRSIYTWQGEVADGTEALVILHTRAGMVDRIIERVDAEHPDDTPQVLAVPVSEAHPGYRQWLIESTGG